MYHISHQGPVTNLRLRLCSPSLSAVTRLSLNSNFASRLVFIKWSGSGDGEIRTLDPLLARQVLSQLSYAPILAALPQPSVLPPPMGLSGLEPPTSRLSGVRSNRLSYKPIYQKRLSRLFFLFVPGSHLLSHTVSSAVPSAA